MWQQVRRKIVIGMGAPVPRGINRDTSVESSRASTLPVSCHRPAMVFPWERPRAVVLSSGSSGTRTAFMFALLQGDARGPAFGGCRPEASNPAHTQGPSAGFETSRIDQTGLIDQDDWMMASTSVHPPSHLLLCSSASPPSLLNMNHTSNIFLSALDTITRSSGKQRFRVPMLQKNGKQSTARPGVVVHFSL